MAKILFIDDRLNEVIQQWHRSGCADNHKLHLEQFESLERTCQVVTSFNLDIILVGFGLGKPDITGSDVIRSLRETVYQGHIIANSGGGQEQFDCACVAVDGNAARNPHDLKIIVNNLTKRRKQ